jgi:hypothetical protein
MKRNALVSVSCALLFTNILVAADAGDIERLAGKCSNGDQKACKNLKAAVGELTDQALLAKIAVESKYMNVRWVAVEKLNDPALLARIAVGDKDWSVRESAIHKLTDAIGKLTDQAVLAKFAVEGGDAAVRGAAVEKLTDQAALAKVAVESQDAAVRSAAVEKLNDPALLARIAVGDKDWHVRLSAIHKLTDAIGKLTDQAALAKFASEGGDAAVRGAAVGKLTDQAALAKIAVESQDAAVRSAAVKKLTDQAALAKIAEKEEVSFVRGAAVEKLTDQALLAKIAEKKEDRFVRAKAIAAMDGSNPALERLAAKAGDLNQDLISSIARIKLAIQEQRIRNRLPRIVFAVRVSAVTQAYTMAYLYGESVSFVLSQDGATLAEKHWSTVFPEFVNKLEFLSAAVEGGDLLAELLHRAEFEQEDLAELSSSEIPEVCHGAVANLTDQAALARVAIENIGQRFRFAALRKLTDQAALTKVAVESKDAAVRSAAVEKLTDQAFLATIAEKGSDRFVRSKAIAAMDGANPAMKRLAGYLGALTSDALESIARIKLAIQEPRIRNRLPRIAFASVVSGDDARYQKSAGVVYMPGERVSFVLSRAGETLAENHWSTDFPKQTPELAFTAASVHGEDLLARLLHGAVFRQDDLSELSSSEIPELRQAAVRNLTDEALLAKIAVEDENSVVRHTAVKMLPAGHHLSRASLATEREVERYTDQVLLAEIAKTAEPMAVRRAAVRRLNNRALLAKIATGDEEQLVRLVAIEKLNDQTLLARIAVGDRDLGVRRDAVEKLNDQALLAEIAVEDKDLIVRCFAVERLTRRALLAKIAVEDEEPSVRRAAQQRLAWLRQYAK